MERAARIELATFSLGSWNYRCNFNDLTPEAANFAIN
jgi:hypothetical protein